MIDFNLNFQWLQLGPIMGSALISFLENIIQDIFRNVAFNHDWWWPWLWVVAILICNPFTFLSNQGGNVVKLQESHLISGDCNKFKEVNKLFTEQWDSSLKIWWFKSSLCSFLATLVALHFTRESVSRSFELATTGFYTTRFDGTGYPLCQSR